MKKPSERILDIAEDKSLITAILQYLDEEAERLEQLADIVDKNKDD